MTFVLGISAYYHDSAACLIKGSKIIAAAQEERFTRKKHDQSLPLNAIKYCLDEEDLLIEEIETIIFYDKPLLKFSRILKNCITYAPNTFEIFEKAIPIWLKEKLFIKSQIVNKLSLLFEVKKKSIPQILFAEHHQSHAASAFFPSPFNESSIICLDGVGEFATSSVWIGKENKIEKGWQIDFPHSLGLLYSAFTYYTGFRVNSGEYKLMGLAPYGEPKYLSKILDNLIDIKKDGSYQLNLDYFCFHTGLQMTNDNFNNLFGRGPRKQESEITQHTMDIARSIQSAIEEVVLKIVDSVFKDHRLDNLCLAGGVALNCVANGKILKESAFKNIWIQPAAGDAGGSLGAALIAMYDFHGKKRLIDNHDSMKGCYLGPKYSRLDIETYLNDKGAIYKFFEDEKLYKLVAELIQHGNVIGIFYGRMEFGPRALGNRSIIGDPRNPKLQSVMNLKIKYRESFRPFAPAVLEEFIYEYFGLEQSSPYMLLTAKINKKFRLDSNFNKSDFSGLDKLKQVRTTVPAVTHVDYSSRVQSVNKERNPRFYKLIHEFYTQTGCPMVINTSFNVRGEPIVNTPEEAYQCFNRTGMDYLLIDNYLLTKQDQENIINDESWKEEFQLD